MGVERQGRGRDGKGTPSLDPESSPKGVSGGHLGRGRGDGCSADLALSVEHQSWGRGPDSLLIFRYRPLGLDVFQSKRWSRVAIQKDILGLWALSMRGDLSHCDIYTDI